MIVLSSPSRVPSVMTDRFVSVPVLVVGVLSELSLVVGHSVCKENRITWDFKFCHVSIHEVAYQLQLQSVRTVLHCSLH